jgi:ABC-type glycerol-3-phosphate transport system permease component
MFPKKCIIRRYSVKELMLAVVFILLGLCFAFPFYFMVISSLKSPEAYTANKLLPALTPVFNSYKWALGVTNIFQYFVNSALVLIATMVPYVFISTAAGFAFAKLKFPLRTTLLVFVLGIMVFPQMVLGVQLYSVLAKLGILNTYTGLVLSYLGYFAPYSTYLMVTYFRSIPDAILEAARMDGASNFNIYWSVMLPLAKPMIATVIIVGSQAIWNDLSFSLLLLQSSAKRTLMAGIALLSGQYGLPVPDTAATLVISSLPIIVLFIFFQRQIQQGVIAGGIKE